MTTIHYDSTLTDDQRRARLYAGDVFVYSPLPESLALVELARRMLTETFGALDPEIAQFSMPVEQFAKVLGELKPRFIHHPECKRLLPAILGRLGCDLGKTYFDVPRMRSAASNNYLTTGIAYAFHPHRDTWYSAPFCQINWWMPVFPITTDNCMAFHPRYFSQGLRNTSDRYNYQDWNRDSRFNAAQFVDVDPRPQPKSLEPVETTPDLRILMPPGGLMTFSAAHLHSTVPNTSGRTRYSIDFRIVNLDDVQGMRGAENVDSYSTGTTMGDYLRCTDLSHLPASATAAYDNGPPQAVAVAVAAAAAAR
jgi:hypothetical protein